MYNLTDIQKETLRWIVMKIREGNLPEEFSFVYLDSGDIRFIGRGIGTGVSDHPPMTDGILNALQASGLILANTNDQGYVSCTLLGTAYEAVDSNFIDADLESVRRRKHNLAKDGIAVALLIVGVLITLVANIATNSIPKKFGPYLWVSWPLLIVLIIVSILLLLKQ